MQRLGNVYHGPPNQTANAFMTTGALEYGIALPQVYVDERIDPAAIGHFAARAEVLGFHSVWTQDQLIGSAATLDAVSLLSFVAARTQKVRLGVSVLVLPIRTPVPLAKSLATLDCLSGGRLDVGLGLGNPTPHATAYGLTGARGERLRRFSDGLAVMKALWSDGPGTVSSGHWPLEEASMEPKPVQRPHPALWFGGRHVNALRRAVDEGDGWMGAGSSTIDEFLEQRALVAEALDAAGRQPETFRIAKRVYVALDANENRAEERLRSWFDRYYGNPALASRVSVWGPASKIIDAMGRLEEGGAEMLLLNPVFDYQKHQETLSELLTHSR